MVEMFFSNFIGPQGICLVTMWVYVRLDAKAFQEATSSVEDCERVIAEIVEAYSKTLLMICSGCW